MQRKGGCTCIIAYNVVRAVVNPIRLIRNRALVVVNFIKLEGYLKDKIRRIDENGGIREVEI
jgi:hypothetical protein